MRKYNPKARKSATANTGPVIRSCEHPLHQPYLAPLLDPERLSANVTELRRQWEMLSPIRDAVRLGLEQAREAKVVGSSLQCSVFIKIDDSELAVLECLQKYRDELEDVLVVSSVDVNGAIPAQPSWSFEQEFGIGTKNTKGVVTVLPPLQSKCPRCWKYNSEEEETLCKRCEEVVATQPGS